MTTAEKIAFIEAQIRKDIPRLMELREGCKVLNCKRIKTIVSNKNNSLIAVDYLDGSIGFLYEKSFEIIGHDIMLNDVLEWLNIINELNTSVFLRKEKFEFQRINEDNKLFIVSWQLSTPYLKDQSEELINFLYNLIKE